MLTPSLNACYCLQFLLDLERLDVLEVLAAVLEVLKMVEVFYHLEVLEVLKMLEVLKVFVNPTLIWNRVAVAMAALVSMGQLSRNFWFCHAVQCARRVAGALSALCRASQKSELPAQKAHIDQPLWPSNADNCSTLNTCNVCETITRAWPREVLEV